jgi:hypothetical protein
MAGLKRPGFRKEKVLRFFQENIEKDIALVDVVFLDKRKLVLAQYGIHR